MITFQFGRDISYGDTSTGRPNKYRFVRLIYVWGIGVALLHSRGAVFNTITRCGDISLIQCRLMKVYELATWARRRRRRRRFIARSLHPFNVYCRLVSEKVMYVCMHHVFKRHTFVKCSVFCPFDLQSPRICISLFVVAISKSSKDLWR